MRFCRRSGGEELSVKAEERCGAVGKEFEGPASLGTGAEVGCGVARDIAIWWLGVGLPAWESHLLFLWSRGLRHVLVLSLGEGGLGPFENLLGGHRPFPREPHSCLHIPAFGQGCQGVGALVRSFTQVVPIATIVTPSTVPGSRLGPLQVRTHCTEVPEEVGE